MNIHTEACSISMLIFFMVQTQSFALRLNFVCCDCCLGLLLQSELVVVVGFCFSSFSFQVTIYFLLFFFLLLLFFLLFLFALYFVLRAYTQRIYTVFSVYKRNDKYSARVPLKNRFSSLKFCLFSFFVQFFFLFSFASFDRCCRFFERIFSFSLVFSSSMVFFILWVLLSIFWSRVSGRASNRTNERLHLRWF